VKEAEAYPPGVFAFAGFKPARNLTRTHLGLDLCWCQPKQASQIRGVHDGLPISDFNLHCLYFHSATSIKCLMWRAKYHVAGTPRTQPNPIDQPVVATGQPIQLKSSDAKNTLTAAAPAPKG